MTSETHGVCDYESQTAEGLCVQFEARTVNKRTINHRLPVTCAFLVSAKPGIPGFLPPVLFPHAASCCIVIWTAVRCAHFVSELGQTGSSSSLHVRSSRLSRSIASTVYALSTLRRRIPGSMRGVPLPGRLSCAEPISLDPPKPWQDLSCCVRAKGKTGQTRTFGQYSTI